MHTCFLTLNYILGYGAHAGQGNGQATKGNGIDKCVLHQYITCVLQLR